MGQPLLFLFQGSTKFDNLKVGDKVRLSLF